MRPYRFSALGEDAPKPAPLLGQHGAEVLKGCLGCTDAQIAALTKDGVLYAEDT